MSKTILIIADKADPYFAGLEDEVLQRKFQTVSIGSKRAAMKRLQVELFASIVVDADLSDDSIGLVQQLTLHPTGALTPIVVIQSKENSQDLFQGKKTILDQTFNKSEITPADVAEYLIEVAKDTEQGKKSGDLSKIPAPFVLQSANLLLLTGMASFERSESRHAIYFDEGQVVQATSSDPQDTFSEFLLDHGVVSVDKLRQVLNESKNSGLSIDDALIKLNIVNEATLQPLQQVFLKRILADIMVWDKGTYNLISGERGFESAPTFRLAVPPCIYEVVKERFPEERLRRFFGHLKKIIVPDPLLHNQINEIKINDDEAALVSLFDKPRSLEEISKETTLILREVLQFIFTLVVLDLCSVHEKLPEPEAPKPKKPKPPPAPKVKAAAKKPPPPPPVQQKQAAKPPASPKPPPPKKKPEVVAETWEDSNATAKPQATPPPVQPTAPQPAAPPKPVRQPMTFSSTPSQPEKQAPSYERIPDVIVSRSQRFNASSYMFGMLCGLGVVVVAALVWFLWLGGEKEKDGGVASLKPYVIGEQKVDADRQPQTNTQQAAASPPAVQPSSPTKSIAIKPVATSRPTNTPAPPQQTYNKVIEVKQTDPQTSMQSYVKAAKQYYKSGKIEEARRLYMQVLAKQPNNGDALVGLANLYYDIDREKDALRYLSKALKADAKNADAHLALGNIYLLRNKKSSAIRSYKLFLKYCDDNSRKQEVRKVLANLQ